MTEPRWSLALGLRRLILSLVPKHLAAQMEEESRQWKATCSCGTERSIWELGGLRYKAYGNPRRWLRCPDCGRMTWHVIHKSVTEEQGRV